MTIETQIKLKENKMFEYLKQNSHWVKELNRNPDNYKQFEEAMKDLYHLRTTHKISDAIDNIDIISSFLQALH